MTMDYSQYPSNWREISLRIRERDGHKCKVCGVATRAYILRSTKDPERYLVFGDDTIYRTPDGDIIRMSEMPDEFDESKHIKVVLTVAHLDHDTTNNDDSNLAALCQLHHLRHDTQQHTANAKRTRFNKRKAAITATGQQELPL